VNKNTPDYTLIETLDELELLVSDIEGFDGDIAIDTEANSLYVYHSKICLIQVSFDNRNWIIDPLKTGKPTPLLKALKNRTLILHGADYDLHMFWSEWKFSPSKIFDTMIGSRYIGDKQPGLGKLVEKYKNVILDKSSQKADWGFRPLSDKLLQYAWHDTAYLHYIADQIKQELIKRDKLDWAEENFEAVLQNSKQIKVKIEDEEWRMKGSHKFNPQELSIVKTFWRWREVIASRDDRPPFKVFPPQVILDCAIKFAGKKELSSNMLPRIPKNLKTEDVQQLIMSLNKNAQLTERELPKRPLKKATPKAPNPQIMEQLKTFRDKIATDTEIEPGLIANKEKITSLGLNFKKSIDEIKTKTPMMNWQYNLWLPFLKSL
jgi:ribonuclease D